MNPIGGKERPKVGFNKNLHSLIRMCGINYCGRRRATRIFLFRLSSFSLERSVRGKKVKDGAGEKVEVH